MKYIKKTAEKTVYNDGIGKVELWDFSRANENKEARIEAVTTVASIIYGNKQAKNPEKLWRLLIERGHESPFEFVRQAIKHDKVSVINFREMDFFTIEENSKYFPDNKKYIATFKIKVPIFVARQIMRHRSFSYMEMSRRYVKPDKVDIELFKRGNGMLRTNVLVYKTLLNHGVRPEIARANLPLCTYTKFWMQGDYKAWLNFFIHRLHPEAQKETIEVAEVMLELLRKHQQEFIKTIVDYIKDWKKECNPLFMPARRKKVDWFKKNILNIGGQQ